MPSESPAQARLMRAVAHGWKKPGGGGPSVKVAKEFVEADKGIKMNRGGKMVRPIAPRLPKALAAQPVPNAPAGPAAGPNMPPPPSGMGMKKGGKTHKMAKGGVVPKTDKVPSDETAEKKWSLKGEAKDKHGEKVAMKRGGKVKKYSGGGSVRGDGIAERGHTRGTFR